MSESAEWVEGFRAPSGEVEVEHLRGVPWYDAAVPSRFHKCRPQTRGWSNYFTRIFRCACGAISRDGRNWDERNSR